MKITLLQVYRYKLPFQFPLTAAGKILTSREGFIIELISTQGKSGYGEIAPFPGLHKENLEAALQQLKTGWPKLKQIDWQNSFSKSEKDFDKGMKELDLSPSVQFGLELALFNLMANSTGKPLYKMWKNSAQKTVNLNGLLMGAPAAILIQAKRLAEQGYRTIKLKVGGQPVKEDVRLVENVRTTIGDDISLRLDANKAWALSDAISFGKAAKDYDIEYLEEPLQNPREIPQFKDAATIPIALDESLCEISIQKGNFYKNLNALVIKPSVVGSIERTIELCLWAREKNLIPVLSSTFDSGLALSALAQLASVFTLAETAMGLDTYKWLKEDLLVTPFKADAGKVDVDKIARNSAALRMEMLTPEARFE
jgi:O-succinylbenzoate synthase